MKRNHESRIEVLEQRARALHPEWACILVPDVLPESEWVAMVQEEEKRRAADLPSGIELHPARFQRRWVA